MTRRDFGMVAAAAPIVAARQASDGKLRAGLIGCGGRGTQAVTDMLSGNPSVELVAMADVFEDKLEGSLKRLRDPNAWGKRYLDLPGMTPEKLAKEVAPRVAVPPENHYVGFDAYKKIVSSGVDVVMLCTPPGYRPIHFEAAVAAGKHIFTEKPVGTDPVGVRRFMAAAKTSQEKKLTVVSGAQRHAEKRYIETVKRIKDGAIGDIRACYSHYMSGPVFHAQGREAKWGDMEWQHRNWYSFVWICGDQIVEQHYHNIDFMNWMMGGHPTKVVATGGISWRKGKELYGNIYDHMASDFEYPGGIRYSSHCRQYPRGVHNDVSDLIVGTKGVSSGNDLGSGEPGINPYVQEHIDLVSSIRGTGPYQNQAMPVAEATMTAIMGRESAYSGMQITWEMIMASQQDLMPKAFGYDEKMGPVELPEPGKYKFV